MTKRASIFLSILIFLVLMGKSQTPTLETGRVGLISDFKLVNVDNHYVSLSDQVDAIGYIVVFTCNHCPFAKLYPDRFNELNREYKTKGVPLIAINSMDTVMYEEESFEAMQKKAAEEKFNFPYLYDPSQKVGKMFKAEHTPQAYVIWKEKNEWLIKYSGAIDDNGEHPELANSFISAALNELLSGKKVSKPHTASFGCRIFYRK